MSGKPVKVIELLLLMALIASSLVRSTAQAQTPQGQEQPAASTTKTATAHYRPSRFSKRATEYYGLVWGIDSLTVKWAESGELIRFSYRVQDADKAMALNDKKNEPVLIDPQAGVKLVVPSLAKVGKLRQSNEPETGKSYWMAFSNKGRLVKRGDRVDIEIGNFRAQGLVVD